MDAAANSPPPQEELNRLFKQFSRGGNGEEAGRGLRTWTPPVDPYETDDALVLQAELPGVPREEVSIAVHQNTLSLRGQRKREAAVEDGQHHRVERAYGPFQRSLVLPAVVDQARVRAPFRDGALELHPPELESAKPTRIAVAS